MKMIKVDVDPRWRQPGEIVDREEEIEALQKAVGAVAEGGKVSPCLVEMTSPVLGMGRTTMLKEAAKLAEERGLSVCQVDFSDPGARDKKIFAGSSYRDIVRKKKDGVLILDNLEKVTNEIGEAPEWLNSKVTEFLKEEGRVVVDSHTRQFTRWGTPFDVRTRTAVCELGPLAEDECGKDLYRFSQGNPGLTRAIAARSDDPEGCVSDFIKEVSVRLPEEYQYTAPLMTRVASILRKLNPTPLRHFAESFGDELEGETGQYLDAIRDMQYTGLVKWSSEAGGYQLDPTLRRIVAGHMARTEPEGFLKRQREAVRLYDDWVDQFPRNAASFLQERTFHRASQLGLLVEDEAKRSKAMQPVVEEFGDLLSGVERHPDVQ